MNPRSHVFVSYARSDGEAFARDVHQRLEDEAGLSCWRDRLDLEGGEDFWRQLEAGVAGARWLLIVLTPAALASPWTAKEWREARKRGVPICALWPFKPSTLGELLQRSTLPAGMQRSHIYTPFAGDEADARRAQEEWANLVATLRIEKEVARVNPPLPLLPADYVDRPVEVEAIVRALLSKSRQAVAVTTALRGVGGMGKTTLAKAVVHRDEVVDAFADGIFWIVLGTTPNLVEVITDLCRQLGDKELPPAGVDGAASRLRGLLENRSCLLVIDDAWKPAHLQPFRDLATSVTRLITTRIGEVARAAGESARIKVDQMDAAQAAALLLAALPQGAPSAQAGRCAALARQLGRWPLLLHLAAGQLRAQLEYGEQPEAALRYIEDGLRQGGVTAFDADGAASDFADPALRDRAIEASIGGSLALLTEADRDRFVALGIFPEDIGIPLASAAQLWRCADANATKKCALTLAELSLVDLRLGDHPVLSLHDHVLTYAARRLKASGRWAATHRTLVDAWSDLRRPPDAYAWRWVCHHLGQAKEGERLAGLLLDFEAVSARLQADSVGIDRLIHDYELLGERPDARRVFAALSRAAHILARHPDLLAQQLVARLVPDTPALGVLVATARARSPRRALLPVGPSLAAGAGVGRQLLRHRGAVRIVRIVDAERIVSGGEDGRVYCAALDGAEPRLLAQHEYGVLQLALSADGRVVSGGRDGRVYCAALDGGELRLLARHEDGVRLLALSADGRVVSGGDDGRVFCTALDGGEPRLLVQHEGRVSTLLLMGEDHAISAGDDGSLTLSSLTGRVPSRVFFGDLSLRPIVCDAMRRVIVAGDAGGRIHILPLPRD